MLATKESIQKMFNYSSEEETKQHTKNIVEALLKVVKNSGNTETIGKVLQETNTQHVGIIISEEEYWVKLICV